jgi:uncharacterized protein YndB with AHSA1/START domain
MSEIKTAQKEIVIIRIFDAPRALVWKAWTDPKHFMQWWGPKDFTCPFATIDLRVGGKYLNCMLAPDGKEYWCTGEYREIIPMERIVYTDCFSDEKGNVVHASYYEIPGDDWPMEMMVTVIFEDFDGKTKMTLTHVGHPGGKMGEMASMGWNESLDKLAESLK